VRDYIPITRSEEPAVGLLGTWWRKPPYTIKRGSYVPSRGEGMRAKETKADILTPERKPTERERFQLEGIEPPLDVVPPGDEGEWYGPAERRGEILDALLEVAEDRLKPVDFANRFGLLGYSDLAPAPNRCVPWGDPLRWFLAHAQTVHVAANLIARLGEVKANPRATSLLAEYLTNDIPIGSYALGARIVDLPWVRKLKLPPNPVQEAGIILRELLNRNLGHTRRQVELRKGGFHAAFTFRALIEVVYWELADQLGKSSLHRCLECKRIFISSNPRARFCPPAEGKKISRCKSLWNVRRFRKKHQRRKR
jgi:hypothetical protein